MRRRLRPVARQLLAAAGTLTLAGIVLSATAPPQANAAQANAAGAHAARARAAQTTAPGKSPWTSGAANAVSWAKSARAAPGATITSDTRSVCGGLKPGYATCMSVLRTNVTHYKGLFPADAPPEADGYGPAQLQSAYRLPSATAGKGETVAIVDAYDDPDAEADLQVYRASYHLPVCDTANGCFRKVNQDGLAAPLPPAAGNAGAESSGWDVEESLDIDMVSAVCPNCRILLVEANSQALPDMYQAEDTAVALGAKFVSNSWASIEYPGETTDDAYFNHPGVAITAAAGDSSYGTLYPASSRYVTAVGGTSLVRDSKVSRGWAEYAWAGTGSGCSIYEPKPAWQKDTGCSHRTVADVSAVADPDTGVALYDSYSADGWAEVGGTSVATPIIAATYALAGLPAAGTRPSSYPYAHPSDLNDVTEGSNSPVPCPPGPYYLCLARPGYDGPTGLGTPDGVGAFGRGVSSGTISGTVSTRVSGKSSPVAGATVTAGAYKATTDSSGNYVMAVPDGTYTVSAAAFGYRDGAVGAVSVTKSQITSVNVTLGKVPRSYTVSGTVSDGSGHRWPLYAAIGISGYRDVATYTDPYTGRYTLSLPEQGKYTLTATPLAPGYATAAAPASVGTANTTDDVGVTEDAATCTAPGYADHRAGATETFAGWSRTPEDGWTVVDNEGDGEVWTFDNPTGLSPPASDDANFAVVDPSYWGGNTSQDTSLVSAVIDLSRATSPVITFDSFYAGGYDVSADVDLSVNGGATWTTVWRETEFGAPDFGSPGGQNIPIPQAAGKPDVRVRFRYVQTLADSNIEIDSPWEVGNVFVGAVTCSPTPGGLVTGVVTDANTGKPVTEATVTSNSGSGQAGTSAADPGVPGYYSLFAAPGSNQLTASDNDANYVPSTQTVSVAANAITRHNWSLQAGELLSLTGSVSVTQAMGGTRTAKVSFLDTGSQPVRVQLSGQSSGFTPTGVKAGDQTGAAPERIRGNYSPLPIASLKGNAKKTGVTGDGADGIQSRHATTPGTAWSPIANYPIGVADNAVGYDPATGNVYSAAGGDNSTGYLTTNSYVYNPLRQQWNAIAPLPAPAASAAGAFADGKFYVIAGVNGTGKATGAGYAYQPSTDSWSQIASLPVDVYAPSAAVLNNTLYVVGGCTTTEPANPCAPGSNGLYRYDPASNRWTALASYPIHFGWGACAGADGEIVCAGGLDMDSYLASASTYVYHPATNTWSPGADMPYSNWAMDYAGSGNMLQVVSGVTGSEALTNQAAEYNPATNTWSALPDAPQTEYQGGGSCGLYQVGGVEFGSTGPFDSQFGDVLPGYDQCGTGAIPWLSVSSSAFTLQPGQVQTVTLTTNSAVVSQPGTYTSLLGVQTNTPYQVQPIPITMTVNPPAAWSEVKGTATDVSTHQPLAGATVQVCANYDKTTGACGSPQYTLTTDSSGDYTLWLNRAYNPLQIIAADVAYEPAAKVAELAKGAPVTVNFALRALTTS